MRRLAFIASILTVACAILVAPVAASAETVLTLWSHWAGEKSKRTFVENAIKRFEADHPGVKIKANWYEKSALYPALKTALRAGQAPDIFYAEPDQVEYMENGFLLDLSSLNWNNIEPWAKQAWTYKGKPYGFPLEASTVEVFYNKKMVNELGVKIPPDMQMSSSEFIDLVKKARAKGWTPMSLGVGDRPFPGTYLIHEALLEKLGIQDYGKLLHGKLPWSDPRVVNTLNWIHHLVELKLLPKTFTSLKLGEAHIYFYSNPGAVMFLNGSWYSSRAFNPPDQGGEPKNFPLGIMRFPKVPGAACPECRTISVQGSYVANAATKHKKLVLAFFNSMANKQTANRWLEHVLVQTGIKSDPSTITGPHANYFKMLAVTNKGAKYFFGEPIQVLHGKAREVFIQVMNNALPAGTISVADAIKEMDAAMK